MQTHCIWSGQVIIIQLDFSITFLILLMKINEKLEKIEAIKNPAFKLLLVLRQIYEVIFQSSESKTAFFRKIAIGNSLNVQT